MVECCVRDSAWAISCCFVSGFVALLNGDILHNKDLEVSSVLSPSWCHKNVTIMTFDIHQTGCSQFPMILAFHISSSLLWASQPHSLCRGQEYLSWPWPGCAINRKLVKAPAGSGRMGFFCLLWEAIFLKKTLKKQQQPQRSNLVLYMTSTSSEWFCWITKSTPRHDTPFSFLD